MAPISGYKQRYYHALLAAICLLIAFVGAHVNNIGYLHTLLRKGTYGFAVLVVAFLGIWFSVAHVFCTGKWYKDDHQKTFEAMKAQQFINQMMWLRSHFSPCKRKVVTSTNLDDKMQEVLDLVTRDFVMKWYKNLGKDTDVFKHTFQDLIWFTIEEFTNRLCEVDFFTFFTQNAMDILTQHIEDIRKSSKSATDSKPRMTFMLYSWLENEDKEMEFLRKTAEIFLIHLVPKEYTLSLPVRYFCREILACSVFKPSIDIICDPDYFNQKVLNWLLYRKQVANEHKNTYTYAATYEEFMRMLENCSDIEHLKQMRYNILSEIMQATTINNLKRAQGIDVDEETSPKGYSKGDLLKARNLKVYINQLTVAKTYCEKRIHVMGGPDYTAYHSDLESPRHTDLPGRKVLSFSVIMENADARESLLLFLKRTEHDGLLKFWLAVETMKYKPKHSLHQLGGHIYQMYITPPSTCVKLHLDKRVIKNMESFMLGDSGPDGYWEAQERIYDILEDKHYPSFILSDLFHQLMTRGNRGYAKPLAMEEEGEVRETLQSTKSIEQGGKRVISAHSTYAQDILQKRREKLENKKMALKALKTGLKLDSKVQKIQDDIKQEIVDLKGEIRQLEFHIERTECWTDLIGNWKARVCNAEMVHEDGKTIIYFIIVVHQDGAVTSQLTSKMTQGWVIHRKLEECHTFRKEVIHIKSSFKRLEIPQINRLKVKSIDPLVLNKAKEQIQTFLHEVLNDECLAQSEITYMFFSPSPDHQKQSQGLHKSKERMSFTKLFKHSYMKTESDSDEDLLFSSDESRTFRRTSERIVEPMYRLISEVFELKGKFKWMRRTLMSFVQVTFGRSIHKQLRATVEWAYSESMIVFYLSQYQEAYWPNGVKAENAPMRTQEEKEMTRVQARNIVLKSIPDALKNLVGDTNSKHGAAKLFDSFQDIRLNKQLFYRLLEDFMLVTLPEIQVFKQ